MKQHFRTILVPALFSLALLGLLTGCPSPGDPEPLDTLVVGISDYPRQMDPRVGADLASSRFHQLVYAGLVARDAQLRPVPDLAESWERPDDLTFVFRLREGLTFHDGSPLTAADVVYSLKTTADPALGSPRAADLERIETIEATDAHTVTIRLREPFAPFLQALVYLGVVPEGSNPGESENHIGAGPFRFVSTRQGEDVLLHRFDGYYGGRPAIPKLRLKVVSEASVRSLELRKGDLHMVVMDLPPDLADTYRTREGFRVLSVPGVSYSYIALNMEDPKLADVRIRKALAHAIDRTALTKHLLMGFAEPASSLLPPWHWAHDASAADYAYDPEKARRLLDQAGLVDPDGPGGVPRLELVYKTSTNQLARQQAAVIQEAWAQIGVAAEIRSFEWGTFFEDLKSGSFQLAAARWVGIVDPDIYRLRFASRYIPPEGLNRGRYRNPEVDKLLEDGLRTWDESERTKIYSRVQHIIQGEVPYISLYYPETLAVVSDQVQGFELYPAGDFLPLARATLSQP